MSKSSTSLVTIGVFVSLLYFSALVPETLAQSSFTGVVKDQSATYKLPGSILLGRLVRLGFNLNF